MVTARKPASQQTPPLERRLLVYVRDNSMTLQHLCMPVSIYMYLCVLPIYLSACLRVSANLSVFE